jgi:hypothetical protein
MSIEFYRILHIVSLSVVLIALGGASFATYSAGGKPASLKKYFGMLHGIGVLVMFVAGFGMLAKMGIIGALPSWALIKMTLWLILGGWIAVVYKLAVKHPLIAALVPVILVALGSATAIYKF